MLELEFSSRARKDFKLMEKRGKNMQDFWGTVQMLLEEKSLPPRYRDHPLKGKFEGYRDCHIQPDWILIYKIGADYLRIERTGTHADLFE